MILVIPTSTLELSLAIGGLMIGAVGIGLAVYYGRRAEKVRRPTFSTQQTRFTVIHKSILTYPDFSILYKGAKLADQNVVFTRIRFWNSGNMPILASDVLTPFRATFPVGCRLLVSSLAQTSRPEIKAKISHDELAGADSIVITTTVLEPNDGLSINVIYAGDLDANIDYTGSCIGASSPLVLAPELVRVMPLSSAWKRFLVLLVPLAVLIALILIGDILHRRSVHVADIYFGSFAGIFGIFALIFLYDSLSTFIRKKRLPKTLLPKP
jgi:hypothetical protein